MHTDSALARPLQSLGVWRLIPALALAFSLVVGWLVITAGTGHPFKPYDAVLAQFYDAQGEAILAGRLDVPCSTIRNDAFVIDGRCYGYFGITLALLRIPLDALFPQYRGHWAGLSIAAANALFLISAYGLLLQIRGRYLLPTDDSLRFSLLSALFILALGIGSTTIFLHSRAVVFHESILWASALALASLFFAVRQLVHGGLSSIVAAGAFAILAINTRPPAGLAAAAACALAPFLRVAFVDCDTARLGFSACAWALFKKRSAWIGVLLAALAVLSYSAITYAKFGALQGLPVQYYKGMSPQKLEHLGGSWFQPNNVRWNLHNYFGLDALEFNPAFPFIEIKMPMQDDIRWQDIWGRYPEARINTIEPSLSLPSAMTALLLVAGIGLVACLKRAQLRAQLLPLILLTLIGPVLLLFAASVSYRYFHEYILFLAFAGAVGVCQLASNWGRGKAALSLTFAILVAANVAINVGYTVRYQLSNSHVGASIKEARQNLGRIDGLLR